MKIGRRLQQALDELDRRGLTDRAVWVSHAGMPQQRIETDLGRLRAAAERDRLPFHPPGANRGGRIHESLLCRRRDRAIRSC